MQNPSSTPASTSAAARLATWLLQHEFLRFLITGSVNTGASWVVYLALLYWLNAIPAATAPWSGHVMLSADKLAYTAAYIFGVMFTYYLNSRWVFRVPMSWRAFLQYPSVYVVQYGVGLVLMHVLVDRIHFPVQLAPLAVIVLTMPVTFLLSRFVLRRASP
ncbi:MAG: GtrA family protein [Pseudomonadales bacterium]|nr:GtrA family protein [Pseudomonadales bacterium]